MQLLEKEEREVDEGQLLYTLSCQVFKTRTVIEKGIAV